jgi:hypothetical protein
MTAAARTLGCRLWTPHIGRDFTWNTDPAVIVVTNNATETRWWGQLASACTAMCLIRGRLRWKSTLQGQTAFYFGTGTGTFKAAFSSFGAILFDLGMAAPKELAVANTSRSWGDRAARQEPRTEARCEYGHVSEVRTSTSRMVRCVQCASDGRTTWILTDPDSEH